MCTRQLASLPLKKPLEAARSPDRITQAMNLVDSSARKPAVHAIRRQTQTPAASLPEDIDVQFKALCISGQEKASGSRTVKGMLKNLSQMARVSLEQGVRVIYERLFEARPAARSEIVWQLRGHFEDAVGDAKLFALILSWLTKSLQKHMRDLARHQTDGGSPMAATQTASHAEIGIYVARFSSGLDDENCARVLSELLSVADQFPVQERRAVYGWIVEIARALPAGCIDEALKRCIHEY